MNNVWLLVSLLFILTKRYDMDIGHKQVKDNRGMRVDQQVERDKDREIELSIAVTIDAP